MSIIDSVVGKISKGAAVLFDKGKEVIAGKTPHLSYQRLKSRKIKVRHGAQARVAGERRRFRNVVLSAGKRNTRGLPAGMSAFVARRARCLEVRALHGHLDESGVSAMEMELADRALTILKDNQTARKGMKRPAKLARRVSAGFKSCRASVMIADQKQARAAFGRA